jgi:hypothetical protein
MEKPNKLVVVPDVYVRVGIGPAFLAQLIPGRGYSVQARFNMVLTDKRLIFDYVAGIDLVSTIKSAKKSDIDPYEGYDDSGILRRNPKNFLIWYENITDIQINGAVLMINRNVKNKESDSWEKPRMGLKLMVVTKYSEEIIRQLQQFIPEKVFVKKKERK